MDNEALEFDLLIAGSGGGGLVAAITAHDLGLKVLVVEKNTFYGGSTALSGGALWIPDNHHMHQDGVDDSQAEGHRYMKEAIGNHSSEERQSAYVQYGPEMIEYLEQKTHLQFQRIPGYSDYYPELPGGTSLGRTLEPLPFNGKRLGKMRQEQNPPIWPLMAKFPVTGKEYHKMAMMRSIPAGKKTLLKVLGRIVKDKLTGRKTMTFGQSLIAPLRLSVADRNIPLWLNTSIKDLVTENGKVVGAIVEKDGKPQEIRVRQGVLMATGGFPHNQKMRDKYQPKPVRSEWSLANKANTGDGIQIGMKYDAAIDLMDDAWWGPVSIMPDNTPFFHVSERAHPGTILVNKKGNRFINEAKPYSEFVHIQRRLNNKGEDTIPCYFITDGRVRKKYSFGLVPAGMMPKQFKGTDYIVKADTLAQLATKVGLPSEALEKTVADYNKMAEQGKDTDFGIGDNAYDKYYGDPSVQPNPCMYPIAKPPFYCMKLFPGDLGTKGGLVTNEKSQVLREDGSIIEGFYATGNTTSSVMGHTYPGAGATIGASMVFGYVAAKTAAAQSAYIESNSIAIES